MNGATLVIGHSTLGAIARASPQVSVIICTKDRPADLTICLDSLALQTTQPAEVIIVDASIIPVEVAVNEFRSKTAPQCNVKLLRASPGLTRQRNIGIRAASGSVILFLDDDTVLDKDYVKEIATIYEMDSDSKIGGVGGAIIPDPALKEQWHQRAFKRIFLLPGLGLGRLKRSGHPDFIFTPRELTRVQFLSGCNMSYRRCVFDNLLFDERLTGYAIGEDVHFSYAVSRRWELVLTPYARIEHREAGTGRPVTKKKREMGILHHLLFFSEQVATGPVDWLCYFWSLVGGLLLTLRHPREGRLAGVLLGYRCVARALATREGSVLRAPDRDGDSQTPVEAHTHNEQRVNASRTGDHGSLS
jgi:GT2 family glycosyltransferase